MKVGVNIKQYRLEKNLTQKDLADMLYISSQAISRWEKDEVEPSLDMLNKMCEIFGCQLNDLVYGKEYQINETKEDEISEEEIEEKLGDGAAFLDSGDTSALNGVSTVEHCSVCGKELSIGNCYHQTHTKNNGTTEEVAYCSDCYFGCAEKDYKTLEERNKAKEKKKNKLEFHVSMKKGIGWGIFLGIVAGIITLCVVLNKPEISVFGVIGYCLLNSYAIFATVFCMITETYINDVFLFFTSKSIRFPGIIFEFSLEGLGFLIFMKILFFLIGVAFGILMFLLGLSLSALLSMVSFPFVLLAGLRGRNVAAY